ncbi:MAG: ferrous iron transport protein B [Bacteroidales bacterium]|nr:ferrous iron transport protein B [Bacteroidales bacterium]
MRLSELKEGERGIITKVIGRGAFRKRLIEMGFVRGKEVRVTKYAPLKDPIEYNIMDYEVSLRKSEANLVEILLFDEVNEQISLPSNGTLETNEAAWRKIAIQKSMEINVALVGNPNCGKTTLFNHAAGTDEHVGNYSGVTIDSKTGHYSIDNYKFNITDLPGTYSLSAFSPEELFVRKHITDKMPDVVVNVVDASNLERNLYLSSQLIDMDIKVVIALNMYDELEKKGAKLDIKMLSTLLGIPIVPTVAAKGFGIEELFKKVIDVYEDKATCQRHIHINYGKETENAIKSIQKNIKIRENQWLIDNISSRFLAIKLLEKDTDVQQIISKCRNANAILQQTKNKAELLKDNLREDTDTLITDARYGFIAGALHETYKNGTIDRFKTTKAIDVLITHKIWGFPIFLFFLYLMFVSTFKLGEFPMRWIDWIVQNTALLFESFMPNGMLKDLIVDGIIQGVGSVIVFLPNILILFLFISLMEDTGYMARVAFIMDKLMHKIGLHGKSFIPMLMGFGCNVPAIMSTRTIENRGDRLLTMLINPFMSCSARLPIYLLIAGTVFPKNAGTVLFGVYFTGIIIAILMAVLFKKTIFKSKEAPFVMELPPYRMPTIKVIFKHVWHKGRSYLKKMGGVILIASIIVWALGYFPRHKKIEQEYQSKIDNIQNKYDLMVMQLPDNERQVAKDSIEGVIVKLQHEFEAERQAKSFIGMIGHFFEPIMRPLGFDWKMTVGVISGVSAKEIVVSTLGVLYQSVDEQNLTETLRSATYESGKRAGKKIFTPVTALAFLVFVLIYFPCIATIAAVKKESGSWKWALFMVGYTTALAWIAAFAVYQIGNLFLSL